MSHNYQSARAVWIFHRVVSSLVLRIVGVMRHVVELRMWLGLGPCSVCRATDLSHMWSVLSAIFARLRASARLTRHSKTLIHPRCKGTESFWILKFLSDQTGLSVHWLHDTWPNTQTYEAMRCWGFKHWMSHSSLPVYFSLSVQVVRCCSHLDWPCEVFHNWGDKTCIMLISRSHDARLESGDTTRVVTSIGVRKCDQSYILWP
jgi:hypothetical protein